MASLDARLRAVREKTSGELVGAHITLINFLRGMIGPGCFSVPLALKYAGLWTGFSLIFIIGLITTINMSKLVRCSQYLCALTNTGALNYGNMTEEAFRQSFPILRKHHWVAKAFVNISLFILQLGVCSVAYIFMVDHLKEVLEHIWPHIHITEKELILIAFLPYCAEVSIRSFWLLSAVSVVGNLFMLIALVIIFVKLILTRNMIPELPAITDFNGVMLAAGSILYAFEGQAVVLPIENKLQHPSEMSGFTGVLSTGMSLTTIIYAFCGFFGYIVYGPKVQGSITLNMDSSSGIVFAVKCLLTMIIFTGYLLQHYVIVEMYLPEMWTYFKGRGWGKRSIFCVEYATRYIVVILSMGLALAVPDLGDIISLIGVSIGMMLAMIVPPLIEWVTFLPSWLEKRQHREMFIQSFFNVSFILIGLTFIIFGLKSNIQNLMNKN
ncbi:unnamed protein product, partial [Mesorhabditis belari]|uniref:Amino acid transporter transmembrane domain-containing protein n=1 Tax=Mesorhabditis belari TaxID=2138241 RepID=A0AAF3FI10_9BILA